MKYIIPFFLLLFLVNAASIPTFAQVREDINRDILNQRWAAKWITCPEISGKEFGVYLFRKEVVLTTKADQFMIHVSADNRYKLYVNDTYVGNGPARGDLLKWYFESINIAPYLKEGKNVIASVVWNFAELRPVAQFSTQTGFILQGNSSTESVVNTDSTWHVFKDEAYQPLPVKTRHYYVVGPGEAFNGKDHPWNWRSAAFDASDWKKAKEMEAGRPLNSFREYGAPAEHVLHAREIPPMEEKVQPFSSIRRSDLPDLPEAFLSGKEPIVIPAFSKIKILFDQHYLTNAYPVLTFSKGKESKIKLTYAESLFNEKSEKGNRNEIENKQIIGNEDLVIADGGTNRIFQSLWWRTFRYVEMDIETSDEPLTINNFYSIFTGYPFVEKASFKGDDPILTDIWNVGWRTQRLCAVETYMDCPYYEQLQYVGDSRIQALVSYYVSGDSRLLRTAIASIQESRLPYGLTQSRYPSYQTQIIPTFSLIWATMVYDYWQLIEDQAFVKSMIPGIMDVLNWYESKIDTSGMLGRMEWWNFVDWVDYKHWNSGTPPGLYDSHSAIISLQYVYTLNKAAALLSAFGMKTEALRYTNLANRIKERVYTTCFDKTKGLIADSPEKSNFSQHANILAILTNTVPVEMEVKLMNALLEDKDIAQCSFYFQFYLIEALEKVGLSEQYLATLAPWKQMLDKGLTTFAEKADPTRSDCHAWSASPVYYLLSLVCGIKPNEPGFKSVRIEPHLGSLQHIEGSMPHPLGAITVSLTQEHPHLLSGEIILPANLTGIFSWKGMTKTLKSGVNPIQFKEKSGK